MSPRLRNLLASLRAVSCLAVATVAHSATPMQQVAVLENTPPVAFRDKLDRVVGALAGGELGAPIDAGRHLPRNGEFQRPGLAARVMTIPDQVGNASFGINPRRPELKSAVDDPREHIRHNGDYERIDTQFPPVRVR